MPARFNAYLPDRAALTRLLEDDRGYRIGRADDCDLVIEHASISRHHAELSAANDGWQLRDSGSKNGVRVDGERTAAAQLRGSAWFTIGDVYCSLETLDAGAAARQRDDEQRRRATSRQLSARFTQARAIGTLLAQALDAVLELSGLEVSDSHAERVSTKPRRSSSPTIEATDARSPADNLNRLEWSPARMPCATSSTVQADRAERRAASVSAAKADSKWVRP